MPELPEVETIKRDLTRLIVGKKIVGVKVFSKKSFQGNPKKIVGLRIFGIERRAKLLIIKLTEGYLVGHLKMTGQMIYKSSRSREGSKSSKSSRRDKYTRVVVEFKSRDRLLFNDLRKFGWLKLMDEKEVEKINEGLGPEPFSKEFTTDYLINIFSKTRRVVKIVLMDQKKIAGIGNIYANEALFLAGIKPDKQAKELKIGKIKKLRGTIIKVLKDGIKYKGSTAKDDHYRQATGKRGSYQNHFWVYQKNGEKCEKCRALIKRSKIGGRGTFFCQRCQK